MRLLAAFLLFFCAHALADTGQAFMPGSNGAVGNTASIAVTASAQSLTCDITATPGRSVQYRLEVNGTQAVTIAIGSTANAPPTAVVGNFLEMLGNTVETFSLPPNAVLSVIASNTGSTLRCTAGYGL
jgi:hypothetical protein